MPKDVRVELKLKNERLYQLIISHGSGILNFCRDNRLGYMAVRGLLLFAQSPYRILKERNSDPPVAVIAARTTAKQLAQMAGCSIEELFPTHLYPSPGTKRQTDNVFLIDGERILPLIEARGIKSLDSQETMLEHKELRQHIAEALALLKPREAMILSERFGRDGNGEHTLRQVAQKYQVGPERIRQIENSALRKLRHPSRKSILAVHVDQELSHKTR